MANGSSGGISIAPPYLLFVEFRDAEYIFRMGVFTSLFGTIGSSLLSIGASFLSYTLSNEIDYMLLSVVIILFIIGIILLGGAILYYLRRIKFQVKDLENRAVPIPKELLPILAGTEYGEEEQ